MKMKFQIRFVGQPQFKTQDTTIAGTIVHDTTTSTLSIGDVRDKVLETEQHLERLLGIRVHIEQIG
jgi:hypothetical protein